MSVLETLTESCLQQTLHEPGLFLEKPFAGPLRTSPEVLGSRMSLTKPDSVAKRFDVLAFKKYAVVLVL